MGACPSECLVGLRRIALLSRMADITTETDILAARAARAPEDARWRLIARNAFPFVVVFGLWEIVARAGVFPPKLFPSLVTVAEAFVNLTIRGILPHHVLDTVLRLLAGFFLAAIVGVTLGILMGRSRRVEDIALPLVSIGAPMLTKGKADRKSTCLNSSHIPLS